MCVSPQPALSNCFMNTKDTKDTKENAKGFAFVSFVSLVLTSAAIT